MWIKSLQAEVKFVVSCDKIVKAHIYTSISLKPEKKDHVFMFVEESDHTYKTIIGVCWTSNSLIKNHSKFDRRGKRFDH